MLDERTIAQLNYASYLFINGDRRRYKSKELLLEFGEFLAENCNIDFSPLGLEEKIEELFAEKDLSGPPLMDVELLPAQEDVDPGYMWVRESFNEEYTGPIFTSFIGELDKETLVVRLRWGRKLPYHISKYVLYQFLLSKGFIYADAASSPPSDMECHFSMFDLGLKLHLNLKYYHPTDLLKELIAILEDLPARYRIGRRGTCQEVDQLTAELRRVAARYEAKFVWAGHEYHPLEKPFTLAEHLRFG